MRRGGVVIATAEAQRELDLLALVRLRQVERKQDPAQLRVAQRRLCRRLGVVSAMSMIAPLLLLYMRVLQSEGRKRADVMTSVRSSMLEGFRSIISVETERARGLSRAAV